MYKKAKFSPLLQASSLGTNVYLGGSSEEGGCSTTCFVQKTNGRGEGKVSFRSSEQHDKLWWFYGMSVCRGDKTSKTDLVVTTLFTITELQVLLEHSERQPEETHQPGQTRFQAADPERRLSLHFPKQTDLPNPVLLLACSNCQSYEYQKEWQQDSQPQGTLHHWAKHHRVHADSCWRSPVLIQQGAGEIWSTAARGQSRMLWVFPNTQLSSRAATSNCCF